MSDLQFDLDLATLDLKGKRFKEAEEKYINIARKENSSVAWCGLAVSKFGQILDEKATVDEVFFCFEKAKNANQEEISSIEKLILQTSFNVISNLYSLCLDIYNIGNSANKQKNWAIVSSLAGGLMGGFSQRSLYGTIVSAGITATSYSSYLKANATLEECKIQIKSIENIIKQIKEKSKNNIEIEKDQLGNFVEDVNKLENKFKDEIKTPAQKQLEADKLGEFYTMEAENRKAIKVQEELSNINHPFHAVKKSAILSFEFGDLKESNLFARQGLNIYSKDEELIKIKSDTETKVKSIVKSGCITDLIIGTVLIFAISFVANLYMDPDSSNRDRSPIPGLIMIAIIILGVVRHIMRRKKFSLS